MERDFLQLAISQAKESIKQGGFPAGSVLVKDGEIIAQGLSLGNHLDDPTSHAETAAIREACARLKTTDLSGATLYASMQPCLMCLGAAMWSSIKRIVFACAQNKVAPEYYGGNYHAHDINQQFLNPIEIVQITELEPDSLAVVQEWEKSL